MSKDPTRRWIFYDIFSGQGIVLHGRNPDLVRAAEFHARCHKQTQVPGDGDRFRLQRIPGWDEVEESQDYVYHAEVAAIPARVEELS